jgi:hypothetical protein
MLATLDGQECHSVGNTRGWPVDVIVVFFGPMPGPPELGG